MPRTRNIRFRARARLVFARVLAATVFLGQGLAGASADPLATCHDNAIIVFDASGSMESSRRFERRIDIAKRAVGDVLPDVARSRATGLVTYSGGLASGCDDVALRVMPALDTSERILDELARLEPRGPTALSAAVDLAARTLEKLAPSGVVVLITDGHETCGRSVCELARQIGERAAGITVHTIGFRIEGPGTEELLCLSRETRGTHSTTRDFTALRAALQRTLACPRLASRSMPEQ